VVDWLAIVRLSQLSNDHCQYSPFSLVKPLRDLAVCCVGAIWALARLNWKTWGKWCDVLQDDHQHGSGHQRLRLQRHCGVVQRGHVRNPQPAGPACSTTSPSKPLRLQQDRCDQRRRAAGGERVGAAEPCITEIHRINSVLFGMQNRALGPYLVLISRILISVSVHENRRCRCRRADADREVQVQCVRKGLTLTRLWMGRHQLI
jgi:hypothetical protein